MQASLLTGLSCWAQRGSAFLCSCAQIMEPSIRSLEPVNRSPLCGGGETNFKANQKKGEKNPKLWHIYQIRSGSERRDVLNIQIFSLYYLCNRYWVCPTKGMHPAKPVWNTLVIITYKLQILLQCEAGGSWCQCSIIVLWTWNNNHYGCFLEVHTGRGSRGDGSDSWGW